MTEIQPDPSLRENKARRLSILILILMALHVLAGVTAIIGVLIAHVSLKSTTNTIYHTHLVWQIKTFWVSFFAYAAAFWTWGSLEQQWPILLIMAFVAYRLAVHLRHWLIKKPINRIL